MFHPRNKEAKDHWKWCGSKRTEEYYQYKIPWCNIRCVVQLQTAHTEHEDDGGYPQQPTSKLATSKWGENPSTISFSIELLYGWVCSFSLGKITQCQDMDSELNQTCRSVTWCLEPLNVENMYLLSGISLLFWLPYYVRRCRETMLGSIDDLMTRQFI